MPNYIPQYVEMTEAGVRRRMNEKAESLKEAVNQLLRQLVNGRIPTQTSSLQQFVGDLMELQGRLEILSEVSDLAKSAGDK